MELIRQLIELAPLLAVGAALYSGMLALVYKLVMARVHSIEKTLEVFDQRIPSDYERREIDRTRDAVGALHNRLDSIFKAIADNHAEILKSLASKQDRE